MINALFSTCQKTLQSFARVLITTGFLLPSTLVSHGTLHAQGMVTGQDTVYFRQDSTLAGLSETDPVPEDTILVNLEEDIELFNGDDPLEMKLIFDIRDLLDLKDDEEYMDAVLHLLNDQDTIIWNIRIKARGEFRRNFCSFPPIMINVKGVDDLPAELKDKKTMKLVTHCRDRRVYREYVLAEYLIYKMYSLVSPYSFDVRLVNISYIDQSDPGNVISSAGFLIENLEHLALRNLVTEADEEAFEQQDMVPEIMARIAVFQYMIGNVDWQAGYHNIEALTPEDAPEGPAIPVPYDFDQTGFVNPEYGVVRTNIGLESIRDRRYLGDCRLNALLPQILDEYAALHDEFIKLIEDIQWLDNKVKRDLLSYLDEFYEPLMEDRSAFAEMLQKECVLMLR